MHTDFTDPTYLVKLDITFATEVYSFQAPLLDATKVPTVASKTWDYSSTNLQVIAPYAYYDTPTDSLLYLGFTSHDFNGLCDCSASTLSGSV